MFIGDVSTTAAGAGATAGTGTTAGRKISADDAANAMFEYVTFTVKV
jgi:hypothetical protein